MPPWVRRIAIDEAQKLKQPSLVFRLPPEAVVVIRGHVAIEKRLRRIPSWAAPAQLGS